MNETLLDGEWELHDEAINSSTDEAVRLGKLTEGWLPQTVPGDVHQGLIRAGRIKKPLLGLNSFDCRWAEERSWWFRKIFPTKQAWLESDVVELELDGLDSNATVFFNGTLLGKHKNSFYPFSACIKKYLKPTNNNILLIRLTAGVEDITKKDLNSMTVRTATEAGNGRLERGDERRIFVRKPQFSFGWDWSPRVATTAIAGHVRIRSFNNACIRNVYLKPMRNGKDILLKIVVTVEFVHYYKTGTGKIKMDIRDQNGKNLSLSRETLLKSGLNYIEMTAPLKNPILWWPNGMGRPHRYTVETELMVAGERIVYPALKYGVRFVEIDTDKKFALVINGKKTFCKGANWIPGDAIYARVSDENYDRLIQEAHQANFNMLRVWGGGLYEQETFYNACDRYGIMVWQDFMFACAPYPDHLDWFRQEVTKEAEYQTVRLRNHACLALWSGCNENNWGFCDWWQGKTQSGAFIYNYLLPETVRKNCPEIPYWNGSPYGGETPNSGEVGDRHHWGDCMMNPEMEKRITPEEYDRCNALFVSEYGYIGAPVPETILKYLNGAAPRQNSKSWQHHINTFEKNTVMAGIKKHYSVPSDLSLPEYSLYSGLCQGLMYGYSLDSFRSKPECHGALFWMYNDCWGEIGWSIIDYYLKRKISYYFVKRALAPIRLILREEAGRVKVTLANDTRGDLTGTLEYGYIGSDGKKTFWKEKKVVCPPLERKKLVSFKKVCGNPDGLWVAKVKNHPDIIPGILRCPEFHQMKVGRPDITTRVKKIADAKWKVSVVSHLFAHAVHFINLPNDALPTDNYFDLLPGEKREVLIDSPISPIPKNLPVKSVAI